MRKLLEILRLHHDAKLSTRQIAKIVNVSRRTIQHYLQLFNESNLAWPLLPEYQNEDTLSQKLNPRHRKQVVTTDIDFNIVVTTYQPPKYQSYL